MKTPLSVHALFHSDNKEGRRIYKELYGLLCRDIDDPFSDGLDIPVYYTTGSDTSVIRLANSSSEKRVILLFIDINMFCSQNWRDKIEELVAEKDDNTLIVGVKQYRHSFSINKTIGETQSIVVENTEADHILLFEGDHWGIFTTQLFDLLIRFVSGKADEKPITIFISHSKQGNSKDPKVKEGEATAKDLRNFLFLDTKLNSFFDVHDILDGYNFREQIKRCAGKCSLLVLFTDTYSSREWCRIEALTAKENKVPMVAVFMMKSQADRVFPYIGNMPGTVYDGDWRKVINLLLRTTLDQMVETELLRKEVNETTVCLPFPPEAFTMTSLDKGINKVIYPEPPLGNEELEVLKNISAKMGKTVSFCTPMSHFTEDINLQEKQIGISIADSFDIGEYGLSIEMFKDLTIEITRHILKANGKMIYGGDLRDKGFTELFRDLAKQYGQKEKAEANVQYIKNYLAWPLYNDFTREKEADYLASRIELIRAKPGAAVLPDEVNRYIPYVLSKESKLKWATSLTQMRSESIRESVARIIAGGKTQAFSGFMPGIAEEFMLAYQAKMPIFLIGGFGGCAHMLADILEHKANAHMMYDAAIQNEEYRDFITYSEANGYKVDYGFFDRITTDGLHDGLEPDDRIRLFHSVDIIEIVSLILKGLSKL